MVNPRQSLRGAEPKLPEGFYYRPELIGPAQEEALLARVLPFREFEFHGYMGKRRVVSFGRHYDFSARHLQKADDIPDFLLAFRPAAAAFAGMEPEALQHVLVTEYGPGSGIGRQRQGGVRRDGRRLTPLTVRAASQAEGEREEMGAGERRSRAALGLPAERAGAGGVGA